MSDRYAHYKAFDFDWPAPGVLRLTFNRPDRLNTLDKQGHVEITEIWRELNADPEVRAVILCGAGRAFSAGGDFSLVQELTESYAAKVRVWQEARDLVFNILDCTKPIVSAIQGAAVGAGLVAGLLADISIAGKSARLADGHTRLGVAAGDHAVILWPLLCSMAKAKYHLLLCDPVGGEEAERIGLVSLCVEDADLQDKAVEIATCLANGAPTAIRFTKHALNNWMRTAGPAFDASLALEMLGFGGPEAREGLASFREKRAPDFTRE
ncbi:enoyl-CoA hydratase/isomerase family protein [Sphingomonas sp. CL5.1]|uniref:enoyl-CoA hydratase/isomerase family protein n=1 Tax=Sphingomonas sp. CL5.1 TaxID=2653203 RepID=UPI0020C735E6|nr:enoyl-CoA hydratase/isomerase family protein [Sphingomonas sp. CL5.1]